MRPTLVAIFLMTALLVGCLEGTDDDESRGAVPEEGDEETGPQRWEVPTSFPVQVRALPRGDVLVASLDGAVYLLSDNGTVLATVIEIEVQGFTGEYGLLGLAVHPDYPDPAWIYVFYTEPAPAEAPQGGAIEQSIARFELPENATQAGPLETLVTLPASPGCCHNGGRVAFDNDGLLYATLGDQMASARAQVPHDPAGSILRYTAEGEIPADNPYPGSPVVVTGMRNTFGLSIDPDLGILATDNGPSTFDGPPGFDQVYVLAVGDNGGWPLAVGDGTFPGRTDPVWHSGDTPTAPTGIHVPRNSTMPEWDDKLLWCNWNTDEAMLLDLAQDDAEPEVVFDRCRFDVTQDGQGRILIAGEDAVWVFS